MKSVTMLGQCLVVLIITFLIFCVLEGFASLFLFSKQTNLSFKRKKPIAERLHTRHDSLLGWSHIPGKKIQNMYGPKKRLTINSQGIRNDYLFSKEVPSDKTRAICSGDSFTMGFGVGDTESWCECLEKLIPSLETLVLAQGGYGVDQAYLWYDKERKNFEHQFHFFAFISPDFDRMRKAEFMGYGKPFLEIDSSQKLVVENFPVPKTPKKNLGLFSHYIDSFQKLAIAKLFKEAGLNFSKAPSESPHSQKIHEPKKVIKLISQMFNNLQVFSEEKRRVFIAIHLPTLMDHQKPEFSDFWRNHLSTELRIKNFRYLDLTNLFDAEPAELVRTKYYIDGKDLDFAHAAGHYNVLGNQKIAEAVFNYLVKNKLDIN